MITDQVDINEFYWGVKTKFKLEIGLKNQLTDEYSSDTGNYPEIVWFKQGTFLISSFNTSIGTNSCTISVQGKDKMSQLNGEFGGQLFAQIDFGTEETEEKYMTNFTINSNTSESFPIGDCYIKVTNFPESIWYIAANNPLYIFLPDPEGLYEKVNDVYHYSQTLHENVKKYTIYKKLIAPEEFFVPMDGEYDQNQYWYQKDTNGVYILDDTPVSTAGRTYYQLIDNIYLLELVYTIKQIPIEKIIREAVHVYAKEPYHNIIINDLNNYGLERITYKGDEPIYAWRDVSTGHFTNLCFKRNSAALSDALDATDNFIFDNLSELVNTHSTHFSANDEFGHSHTYSIAKITYGQDIGYRATDLIYPGNLINSIGESFTSILDKIKNMLDDFEYFYDVDGRFIFQKKKIYVNTAWTTLTTNDDESYVDYSASALDAKFAFNFEGNHLITAIQNAPVLTNLRNDFVVWGKRKSLSGAEIPIHARYAIDKKPVYYKSLDHHIYTTDLNYLDEAELMSYDFNPSTNPILDQILNFQMEHQLPAGLQADAPTQLQDGSWTPGWWSIQDWARFYELLTGEQPRDTMKFYSQGTLDGCINTNKLPGYSSYSDAYKVWLVEGTEYTTIGGGTRWSFNVQHGSSRWGSYHYYCSRYTSEYINPDTPAASNNIRYVLTGEKREYQAPYAGCTDTHTYLYFMQRIASNACTDVFFYNPAFPNGETYTELINNKIDEEYRNWLLTTYIHVVDWREIIYQMALDYFAAQGCSPENPLLISDTSFDPEHPDDNYHLNSYLLTSPDTFLYEVGKRNPYYYPTGYTGYEQYYTDLQGFWRQLYNPNYVPVLKYSEGQYVTEQEIVDVNTGHYINKQVWHDGEITDCEIQYYFSNTGISQQIGTLLNNGEHDDLYNTFSKFAVELTEEDEIKQERKYWNRTVFEAPETLNFWFEFLDSASELAQFSVPQVGDRIKVVSETQARAIVYQEVPDLVLCDRLNSNLNGPPEEVQAEYSGYTFIYLPKGLSQCLNISARGVSVKDKIDALLYQYAYCIENITLTAIPVYYLEPNTRIYVCDQTTNINGEYIVNKITLPLAYNGTMSINATKAPERLL